MFGGLAGDRSRRISANENSQHLFAVPFVALAEPSPVKSPAFRRPRQKMESVSEQTRLPKSSLNAMRSFP